MCAFRRRAEYELTRIVTRRGGELVFAKRPVTDAANDFLSVIAERERLAQTFFEPLAETVVGRLEAGELCYPYMEWPTLAELVAAQLRVNAPAAADALVRDYVAFIHGLSATRSACGDFARTLHLPAAEVAGTRHVLRCGPLDCIPRNVLVATTRWFICDHEWFYAWPIPRDFIIYRGLMSLAEDVQADICSAASERYRVVLLYGFGRRRRYIPVSWYDWLRSCEAPMRRYARWEHRFQELIGTGARRVNLRSGARPVARSDTRLGPLGWLEEVVQRTLWWTASQRQRRAAQRRASPRDAAEHAARGPRSARAGGAP